MPRKARIDAAGALHHIIVRGIERRKIFYDDADRDAFVNRLGRQQLERRYHYQAKGYDFDWLVDQVATLFGLEQDIVMRPGRYPDTVEARNVLWLLGSAETWPQHLGAIQKAWYFATHGQSIGKTG